VVCLTGEDGYSGVEVRVTPVRTEIVIRATRTQNVLGEKGQRIRELTSLVQKRFNFPVCHVMSCYSHLKGNARLTGYLCYSFLIRPTTLNYTLNVCKTALYAPLPKLNH
jgi:hypothetical protein